MSTKAPWPLRPGGKVGSIINATECIAISIPASSFSGISMNSLSTSYQKTFQQVFLRIGEEAIKRDQDKTYFFVEGLTCSQRKLLVGYRFFVVMKNTDGNTLNVIGSNIVNDRRQQQEIAASGDKSAKIAKDFIKRADTNRLFPHEEWRAIPNVRIWGNIVNTCTSLSWINALDFTGGFFSLESALALSPQGVCDDQGPLSLGRYLFTPPGMMMSQTFSFPLSNYVYIIPPDLCFEKALYDRMIPDTQIDFAFHHIEATRLIPMLVTLDQRRLDNQQRQGDGDGDENLYLDLDLDLDGDLDLDLDDAQVEAAKKELLEKIGAVPFKNIEEAKETFEEMSCVQGTNNDLMLIYGITPFDEPRKNADIALDAIRKWYLKTMRSVGVRGNAYLHSFPTLDGNDQIIPYTEEDRKTAVLNRRLRACVQDALADMFTPLIEGSTKMSASGRIIVQYGKDHKLDSLENTKWFYENRPMGMSPSGYFLAKTLIGFEQIFNINTLHRVCAMVEESSLDAYFYSLDLHLNMLLFSDAGATGKSEVFKVVFDLLRIPGTVETILYSTTAAFAVDGDSDGNRNFSDQIRFFDEFPPGFFSEGSSFMTDMESRLKSILTNMWCKYQSMKFNANGDRESTGTATLWCSTHFGCANIPPVKPGLNGVSHAMLSRWHKISLSEPKGNESDNHRVSKRSIEDSMLGAEFVGDSADSIKHDIQIVFHQRQWWHFMIEKLIHIGALANVSRHGAAHFVAAFIHDLSKEGMFKNNPRVWLRVFRLARVKCIGAALIKLMEDFRHGFTRDSTITVKKMMSIEPMLYITVEQVISAISDLSEEMLPSLPFAIQLCIKQKYDEKILSAKTSSLLEEVRALAFYDIFSREGMTETNQIQRNFSYFSIPKAEMLQYIVASVSGFLGGFQPSPSACEAALESLNKLSIRSKGRKDTVIRNEHTNVAVIDGEYADVLVMRTRDGIRPGSKDLEFHIDWIAKAMTNASGNVQKNSHVKMKDIITKLMNSKHQLPRKVSFGDSNEGAHKAAFLPTRSRMMESERPLFRVENKKNHDDETDAWAPEYRDKLGGENGFQEWMTLNSDIDTYALTQHLRKIGYSSFTVGDTTNGKIKEALNQRRARGEEDDEEDYFFGTRVSDISPDKLSSISDQTLENIRNSLETEDRQDRDFKPQDYICTVDGVRMGHWNIVKENFSPIPFGYTQWADDEQDLRRQYKMIAYHPIIMEDRYMTPYDRIAKQQERIFIG